MSEQVNLSVHKPIRHLTPAQAFVFINVCRQFAEELAASTGKNICVEKYLRPEFRLDNLSLYQVFMRILVSASNAQMKRNVIDFSIKGDSPRRPAIIKAIFPEEDLDIPENWPDDRFNKFLREHLVFDAEAAFQRLDAKNLIKRKGKGLDSWSKWLHTVADTIDFLKDFNSGREFANFFNQFEGKMAFLAPIYLQSRIFGLGFALSCDALKEIGFERFVKPDVHVMRVLQALNLSKGRSTDLSSQINSFDALIELVNQANKSSKLKKK